MDLIQKELLEQVADLHEVPAGAYNIRANGSAAARNTTANIDIVSKEDKYGIDIIIKPGTKKESVHIPVVLSQSGMTEMVYNDFYIGDDCDVTIIAGCGIHNSGNDLSKHDGLHSFYVGKNSKVRYVEKHYGSGDGKGGRVMNPETAIHLDENAYFSQAKRLSMSLLNLNILCVLLSGCCAKRFSTRMMMRRWDMCWWLVLMNGVIW